MSTVVFKILVMFLFYSCMKNKKTMFYRKAHFSSNYKRICRKILFKISLKYSSKAFSLKLRLKIYFLCDHIVPNTRPKSLDLSLDQIHFQEFISLSNQKRMLLVVKPMKIDKN